MSIKEKNLVVLWTSGDREVSLNMVFMYTFNAILKEWWKKITLIIWGPSAELASVDKETRDSLQNMKQKGIILEACRACADKYGVCKKLEEIGVNVRYMGGPLTKYIKEGRHILTF
jgi:hypothetical protein